MRVRRDEPTDQEAEQHEVVPRPARIRESDAFAFPRAQDWMLNQVPPGPSQLKPSPHVAIVFPLLITAISP
jgi:hypothetical protein